MRIWLIPRCKHGITDYVYLGIDGSQRLVRWGVSEFMAAFPADAREGY